jgi:hypothetical protein
MSGRLYRRPDILRFRIASRDLPRSGGLTVGAAPSSQVDLTEASRAAIFQKVAAIALGES